MALAMLAVAQKHKGRFETSPLCWLMLGIAEWSLANALEICSVGLRAKVLWLNIEYAGIAIVPVAWLAASLGLAGKSDRLTRRNVLLLLVIPAVTQVIVWTNSYHGLMFASIGIDADGPIALIVKTYGLWFWVWITYSYTMFALGIIGVMRVIVGLPSPYRAQATLVSVGVLVPWAANIIYISVLSPMGHLDITPIAFVIAALAGALAIFRYRLLDIQPIAWATVVGGMDDGVIVTDVRGRVMATNPAAQALTGWSNKDAVGRDAQDLMGHWPQAIRALMDVSTSFAESMSETDDKAAYYEFRFFPLLSPSKAPIGRLIVIHDVTESHRTYEKLVSQHRALAAMEEREALARDMHDDICQVLGYLNFELQSAQAKLAGDQTAAVGSDLDNLIGVVREAQAQMRSYIRSMMGEAQSRWEFVPRLQELLRGIESRYGILTTSSIPEDLSEGIMGYTAELQLLRIIQEACANTAKHADASHLWISVEHTDTIVEVAVADDGKGFNVVDETHEAEGGLGLSIMRERAERLGGDFTVRSTPGKGTEIRVCIPLRPAGGGSCREGADC